MLNDGLIKGFGSITRGYKEVTLQTACLIQLNIDWLRCIILPAAFI